MCALLPEFCLDRVGKPGTSHSVQFWNYGIILRVYFQVVSMLKRLSFLILNSEVKFKILLTLENYHLDDIKRNSQSK